MARFLLVGSDGVEVRAVDAPDIEVARTRLGPRGGQFVVSAASWAISQLVRVAEPAVQLRTLLNEAGATRAQRMKAERQARWRANLDEEGKRRYLDRQAKYNARARKAS